MAAVDFCAGGVTARSVGGRWARVLSMRLESPATSIPKSTVDECRNVEVE